MNSRKNAVNLSRWLRPLFTPRRGRVAFVSDRKYVTYASNDAWVSGVVHTRSLCNVYVCIFHNRLLKQNGRAKATSVFERKFREQSYLTDGFYFIFETIPLRQQM